MFTVSINAESLYAQAPSKSPGVKLLRLPFLSELVSAEGLLTSWWLGASPSGAGGLQIVVISVVIVTADAAHVLLFVQYLSVPYFEMTMIVLIY